MALFSKRHYWALRDALRQSVHRSPRHKLPIGTADAVDDCISSIAAMLERDNPAFERQRFITEIYVPEAATPRPRRETEPNGGRK